MKGTRVTLFSSNGSKRQTMFQDGVGSNRRGIGGQDYGGGGGAMQQQANVMQVACPACAGAGSMLTITAPDGQQMQVQVPAGVGPGGVFQVALPPPQQMLMAQQPQMMAQPQQLGQLPAQAAQQPQMAAQPPAPQPRQLQVVCPPDAAPGATLTITAPDGQQLQVQLPDGVTAGQAFMVNY